jgi:hypothetical protein
LAEAAAPLGSERLDLSDLARLVVEAQLRVPAHLVVVLLPLALAELADLVQEARLAALAHVVVEAQLLQLLRSQSLSASTARNSLSPVRPTYERAPSSR